MNEATSESWNDRLPLFAAIGLVTGLLSYWLVDTGQPTLWRITLLGLALVAAAMFGLVAERRDVIRSALFALACGAVAGLILWWNGPADRWGASDQWRVVSLVVAVAVAAPLFQAVRAHGLRFPYAAAHDHAWTDAIVWGLAWVFAGVVMVLGWLVGALFGLIGLDFVNRAMEQGWFLAALMGVSAGTGLAQMRAQDAIVGTLQRVVMAVLGVLAPVLGAALLLFLLALPFTGLGALWEATRATTPILLSCLAGAVLLVNAVLGNRPGDEASASPLRYGAMALGLAMVPLALIAAIATGLRIDQYGLTPDRLWALTFVVLASVASVAYLAALLRGRRQWGALVHRANVVLAWLICFAALFLATPLAGFNALATRDQVARLESGAILPERFDWAALRFDFGEPGRRALARLAASPDRAIARAASEASKLENRGQRSDAEMRDQARRALASNVRVLPAGSALPSGLAERLAADSGCLQGGGEQRCTLFLAHADALVINDACFQGEDAAQLRNCADPQRFVLRDGSWEIAAPGGRVPDSGLAAEALKRAYAAGELEVRTVARRQLFVGGEPVGAAFE